MVDFFQKTLFSRRAWFWHAASQMLKLYSQKMLSLHNKWQNIVIEFPILFYTSIIQCSGKKSQQKYEMRVTNYRSLPIVNANNLVKSWLIPLENNRLSRRSFTANKKRWNNDDLLLAQRLRRWLNNWLGTAVQGQTAATDYLRSKQLLPFTLTLQSRPTPDYMYLSSGIWMGQPPRPISIHRMIG